MDSSRRCLPILVDVDVVIEVGLERGRVAARLVELLADVLQPPAQIVRIREGRLPAIGVADGTRSVRSTSARSVVGLVIWTPRPALLAIQIGGRGWPPVSARS